MIDDIINFSYGIKLILLMYLGISMRSATYPKLSMALSQFFCDLKFIVLGIMYEGTSRAIICHLDFVQ